MIKFTNIRKAETKDAPGGDPGNAGNNGKNAPADDPNRQTTNGDAPRAEIQLPADNRYLSDFGRELGLILAPYEFFRRFNKCVRPQKNEKGEINLLEVDAQQFRALIESHCAPWIWRKGQKGKPVRADRTISIDDSRATLVTGDFLEGLRPIRAFNLVRLPGFYGQNVALLPLGYCPVHKSYTAPNALAYPEDIPIHEAKCFLDNLFCEFPFVSDREHAVSTVLAGALTLFCANLFPENVIRPNFCALANSEGAGKTLILKIAIIPMLGKAPAGTAPKDEDEMRKMIGAAALSGSPVFFLDNIKGHLSSASLEALTTSPTTSFRFLGQSKLMSAEHGLTVFITGNRATFSPDLRRRTLSIDLFLAESRPESRTIKDPLDDARLIELRPEILGALWALVRNWQENGFAPPKNLNQSFSTWSKVVGGILEAAGYHSPSRQAGSGSDGDRELSDMESLVGQMKVGSGYSFSKLVALAREHHLFEWIIGEQTDDEEEELDPKARTRFSRMLRDRYVDRTFINHEKPVRFVLLSKTARKTYGIVSF